MFEVLILYCFERLMVDNKLVIGKLHSSLLFRDILMNSISDFYSRIQINCIKRFTLRDNF